MISWLMGSGVGNPLNSLSSYGGWGGRLPGHLHHVKAMGTPGAIIVCGEEEESIDHLFYNCSYSRKVLMNVYVVKGFDSWKQVNSPVPGIGTDLRTGQLMENLQSFSRKSNCWSCTGIWWDPSHGTFCNKWTGGWSWENPELRVRSIVRL